MEGALEKILITEDEIRQTVKKIAAQISEDYRGREIILMIILKGSVIFAADLVRYIQGDAVLDFMQVSSYGNSSVSSGDIQIKKDCSADIYDKDVLIVEDIVDTGNTLSALKTLLEKRGARVEICSLLSKPARRETGVDIKYLGEEIPDEFVVGYGLDFAERYRNLPYIGILKEEVYQK